MWTHFAFQDYFGNASRSSMMTGVPAPQHQQVPQFTAVVMRSRLVLLPDPPDFRKRTELLHLWLERLRLENRFQAGPEPLRQRNGEAHFAPGDYFVRYIRGKCPLKDVFAGAPLE